MDQLCKRDYQVSKHVKYRDRETYLSMFGKSALALNDRLAAWTASKLRRLDSRLRARGVTVPNSELLVLASDKSSNV